MTGVPPTGPLQVIDPAGLVDLPGLVRAPLAFGLVLVVGAAFVYRYDGLIDRSMEAAIDRPLSSMAYGVAAHLTIAFFGVYTASQLGTASAGSLAVVGLWVGLGLLAVVAALGFTVVGSAVVETRWDRTRWYGLVVGAAIAGLAALGGPVFGGVVWLIVVSMGVGGSVRRWFHASEGVEPR